MQVEVHLEVPVDRDYSTCGFSTCGRKYDSVVKLLQGKHVSVQLLFVLIVFRIFLFFLLSTMLLNYCSTVSGFHLPVVFTVRK